MSLDCAAKDLRRSDLIKDSITGMHNHDIFRYAARVEDAGAMSPMRRTAQARPW